MKKASCVIGVILGVLACLFWFGMLFYAFFLGGSPGPGYERTVPIVFACIIAFGWLGSILALISSIIDLMKKRAVKALPVCAALLIVLGSIPFFMLDLILIGVIALLLGLIAPLLSLFFTRNSRNEP